MQLVSAIVLLLFPSMLYSDMTLSEDECFEKIKDADMGENTPYKEKFYRTVARCLRKCRRDKKCAGVEYDKTITDSDQDNCNLYNVVPADAGKKKRRRNRWGEYEDYEDYGPGGGGPRRGRGRYGPGSFYGWDGDEENGPTATGQTPATAEAPKNNTERGVFETPAGRMVLGAPLDREDIEHMAQYAIKRNATNGRALALDIGQRYFSFYRPYMGPGPSGGPYGPGPGGQPRDGKEKEDNKFVYRWLDVCDRFTTVTTPRPTPPPLPAGTHCPAGNVARFLKIDQCELAGAETHVFDAQSAEECCLFCAKNRLPDNKFAPCRSCDFDREKKHCAFSMETLPPDGSGTRIQNEHKDYYQKACLPKNLISGCDDTLNQLPNTMLVGFARGVTTEKSYAECIISCLNSKRLFNFKCESGQYFGEVNTDNCILNTESKETKPGLLNTVHDISVIYFDFFCEDPDKGKGTKMMMDENNIIRVGQVTWGPWSACNKKTHEYTRFRKCLSNFPKDCERESAQCSQT